MRCLCTTLALFLSLLVSGCRTQTATLTNPFLAPDRVPPPSTRTLMPGTAQPYYPGDPVPNSPAIAPPGGIPTFAPPGGQVIPPAGQVAPPSGWNNTPQPIPSHNAAYLSTTKRHFSRVVLTSILGPVAEHNSEQIQIQTDEQNLRFAQQVPQQSFVAPPGNQFNPGLASANSTAAGHRTGCYAHYIISCSTGKLPNTYCDV